MSADRRDGGPAFPGNETTETYNDYEGMSLRDYFAAHAPAAPWPWFEPTMPSPPSQPAWADLPDGPLREEARKLAIEELVDAETPEGEAWLARQRQAWFERQSWESDRVRQRLIQWPYAWADAMLAQRAR